MRSSRSCAEGIVLNAPDGTIVAAFPRKRLTTQPPPAGRLLTHAPSQVTPPDRPLAPTPGDVGAAARAFAAAVDISGLRLSPDLVASFVAAVAAKPFIIITGQSGSGKTQLAMRFGEWVGSDSQGRPR